MKPKVLFFFQLPPPVHGASVVNKNIKDSEYINSRIEARYVNISPAKEISDLGKLSLKKVWLTFSILFKGIVQFFKFSPQLVYLTLTPHGAGFWKDSLLLTIVKLFNANVTVHMHGKGIADVVNSSLFLKFVYRFVFKGVNVIHLSESLFDDVKPVIDSNKKFFVVNNGVKSYHVDEKHHGNVVNFVYLSNFVPTKGADTFVAAINLIDTKYKEKFSVKMIGKVSEKDFYQKLVADVSENFTSNVEFVGPLYGDDKVAALSQGNVFVLPTRYKNECFPLSILEAMDFGLPILSTFEGAIPDIVDDGTNGWLFDASNAADLARRMMMYMDNPELIKQHGNNARVKFDERYRLEIFEKNFVEVILEASVR